MTNHETNLFFKEKDEKKLQVFRRQPTLEDEPSFPCWVGRDDFSVKKNSYGVWTTMMIINDLSDCTYGPK